MTKIYDRIEMRKNLSVSAYSSAYRARLKKLIPEMAPYLDFVRMKRNRARHWVPKKKKPFCA